MHSATPTASHILLKTAVAEVQSTNGTGCDANIMFDEGSQRSFVTRQMADQLAVKTIGTEVLNLSGFGSTNGEIRNLDKVRLFVIGVNNQRIPIEALVVPNIGVPLQTHSSEVKELKYLRNLQLAHKGPGNTSFEIQILIGADYYWNFIMDHVVRGNGPTAVQSKLGYLLSGPSNGNSKSTNIGVYKVLTEHKDEEVNLTKFWEIEDIPDTKYIGANTRLREYQDTNVTRSYTKMADLSQGYHGKRIILSFLQIELLLS
ncbi:uncharacterized protein [Argopecten irradians]|uniref:uncharacterized protein n=1 Tax=Argopecten irradians TaxID=31199 RepID=UPI0037111AA8